jgi:DNA-directed RNA polymerase specialized sigma subunit
MSNETTDYIADNLEIAVENYIAALGTMSSRRSASVLDQKKLDDHIMSIMSWMDTTQLVEFIEHWSNKGK